MSASKRKGTAAETAVVRYLQQTGHFPYAERRALHGTQDRGDVTGIGPVVLEVKNHKEHLLSKWVNELEIEIANADANTGAVIAKKRGTTNVADWYAILPVHRLIELLIEAGYGDGK